MREEYPFFRDGDERTQAVIGAEAADADLDGEYQKPYAVLTQKRLYCKNEHGNFITDASTLKSAGKGLAPGQNWFLWAVVGCVSLVLALLCLWYWCFGGRWRTENINYDAQRYIDNYHALEEKIPEYEQAIKDYEDAEKEMERLQKKLEDMDYAQIQLESNLIYQKADRLQAALDEASAARDEQQRLVYRIKNEIAEYNRNITEAENKIENTDTAKNNSIPSEIQSLRSEISYYEELRSHSNFSFFAKKFGGIKGTVGGRQYIEIDGVQLEDIVAVMRFLNSKIASREGTIQQLQNQYVDIEYLQNSIEWNRQYIADSEGYLVECQQQLEEAQKAVDAAWTEVNNYQTTIDASDAKMNEAESLRANIAQKQSDMDSIPLANAQSQLQKFKDSKADYKNAQSVQRKVNLFLPCLLAFAACVVVFILLTAFKRAKPAVAAALVSTCVGLVCASLSDINLPNIQGFGWGDYYIMPPPLSIALRVLPILAVILGVLALWWNRRKTVFQIVHNTGIFSFTPSVYPTEELRQFAEQVRLMREGAADGK